MSKTNYRCLAYYLSVFVVVIGILQLIPLLVLPFYPEEAKYAYSFIIPGLVSIVVGILISHFLSDCQYERLNKNDDSILVVSIWLLAIFISCFPWMLSGQMNFTQAAFEMTSGFSTTGLTVCDVDNCTHMFLLFRSITLFVGGVGFVLILSAALSDRYDLNIYNAEGHSDRLLPNLKQSARFIFSLYSVFIVGGSIAYYLAGMNVFDAINTSIGALSTGGFTTIGESIYGYHSLPIEIISIVLMLLGCTNFMIHFNLLRRKFRPVLHNAETKFMIAMIIIFLPIMIVNVLNTGYCATLGEAIRVSAFQFVSCLTTTGFQSVESLSVLPFGFTTVMVILMLIGGDAESTAGGIKQYRVVVALKGIWYSIIESHFANNVVKVHFIEKLDKKNVLSDDEIRSTTTYIMLYIIMFLLGSLVFTLYGNSLGDSMLEFSSALSTVGLSVGITNFNAPGVILWTAIIAMFFGRLEVMIIFKAIMKIGTDINQRVLENNKEA
ncbi:MAG: TrkH family potassium uptake protein [Erysipelotrichaceae bacterium]|nr:TrkH family potassium uptake protein [Erysipelotrichaceae bacterium]